MAEPHSPSPLPTRRLGEFYRHQSFEDLAREHGVQPASRLGDYQGGWPEDQLEDGFEDAVSEWRRGDAA